MYKTMKSTKTMMGANNMTPTASYKLNSASANNCHVLVKIAGREIGLISCSLHNGDVMVMSEAHLSNFKGRGLKPIDTVEAVNIARKYFKLKK